jgi:hypothetical protein
MRNSPIAGFVVSGFIGTLVKQASGSQCAAWPLVSSRGLPCWCDGVHFYRSSVCLEDWLPSHSPIVLPKSLPSQPRSSPTTPRIRSH